MSRRTYVNAISVIGARDGTDIDSGTFCPTVTLIRSDQTEPRLAVEALFVADRMLHALLAHVVERHRRKSAAGPRPPSAPVNVEARELDVWPRSCARPCVWDIAALIVHGCAYKERDLAKILVVMAITYNVT